MPTEPSTATGARPDDDTSRSIDQELAGLDALETSASPRASRARRAWAAAWPKFAAVAIGLGIWQLVYLSGWKPHYVLPPPAEVFGELWIRIENGTVWTATTITIQRAFTGFAAAVLIGMVVGALIARVQVLRTAFGSFITGLQTMPSIVWFPFAILLFGLTETAIFFVVVLGAAPSIANGLIAGADQVPPILVRAGRVLGARGLSLYRHVILPASLPSLVAGLKQGWAFAWRSLMAGELLVIIPGQASLGAQLQFAREFNNMEGLMAMMIVILVIGILVDALFFGTLERSIRRRWGLVDVSTTAARDSPAKLWSPFGGRFSQES